jgi:glucose dehydrogenase
MNRRALQDKLKDIGFGYPTLVIPWNKEGIYIVDRSDGSLQIPSPSFPVSVKVYASIMNCTALDRDLYFMLIKIGMDTKTALVASLEYD